MDAAGIEALRKQFLDGLGSHPALSGSQKERPPLEEMYDAVMGFVYAVDWTDPFIIGIVVAIATMYAVVFATRKHVDAQIALLAVVCAVAYAAPHASRALGPHWQQLARQDYFDKHGYFGSMMVSLPLMLLALIQMGMAFCSASTLLVQYKRKQLRVEGRAAAKEGPGSTSEPKEAGKQAREAVGQTPRARDASKPKAD
ncbi:hypothetical protein FNF29_08173 [Cafeteria roenbergensis]|uniref:Uncharacterized protein n=2 Tax=Cafeteria roenbergensis TaxID=33653 RepID=A0A5A8CBK6_CAFRO|nr:hypothetical protein FNF29_08173 [Cafeteria roenbergensis]KAA0146300.1 hypothetical protein FNF28_07693 [Cafeteria roenbergensis]KAA0150019.1 hypothetical protein FNF31_07105 [Cafeteria roenbergensis]|eukprot:KAA0146224.1 hypothetical protein FNF29_08173 [Cafeteria roenbergensis]